MMAAERRIKPLDKNNYDSLGIQVEALFIMSND